MQRNFRLLFGFFVLSSSFFWGTSQCATAQVYELSELVVTAERPESLAGWAMLEDRLGSASLDVVRPSSPNQLLQRIPSLNLNGATKGLAGAPSVRGFPNHTLQVLLNGTPINTPWANWANLLGMPLRRMTNVVLGKSGAGLIYGPGGLAGSLNLNLPEAADLPGLRFQESVGNFGEHTREVQYGRVGSSTEHLFGVYQHHERGYQTHSASSFDTFSWRGKACLSERWRVRWTIFDVLNGHRELPDQGDPTMAPQTYDMWRTSHRDLVFERGLPHNGNLTLRLYRNTETTSTVEYTDNTYAVEKGSASVMDSISNGCELLYSRPWRDNQATSCGFQYRGDQIDGAAVGSERRKIDSRGFFVHHQFSAERWKLNGTWRRDNHSLADTADSWQVAGTWDVIPRLSLGAGYSLTSRFPVMREAYMAFQGQQNAKGMWTATVPGQGNPEVGRETARNVDVGLSYQIAADWRVSINRFQAHVEDLIDREFNPNWPTVKPRFIFQNRGKVELQGWETSLSGHPRPDLSVTFGYSRLERADDTTEALAVRLNERPNYRLTGILGWQRDPWQIELFGERRGESPYLATGQGKSQWETLPATTRLNLSMRRRLGLHAQMIVTVDNLTDARSELYGHAIGSPEVLDWPRRAAVALETVF